MERNVAIQSVTHLSLVEPGIWPELNRVGTNNAEKLPSKLNRIVRSGLFSTELTPRPKRG